MNAETAETLLEAIMRQDNYLGCRLCRMGEAEAGFKRSVVVDGELQFCLGWDQNVYRLPNDALTTIIAKSRNAAAL